MVKVQKATDSNLTMIVMEVVVAKNHQHFDHLNKRIVFVGDLLTLMSCQASGEHCVACTNQLRAQFIIAAEE